MNAACIKAFYAPDQNNNRFGMKQKLCTKVVDSVGKTELANDEYCSPSQVSLEPLLRAGVPVALGSSSCNDNLRMLSFSLIATHN